MPERLAQNGELTLDDLCVELADRGVIVHRSNVGRLSGWAIKSLRASEHRRPEIARARELWTRRHRRFFNKALARLIFIVETSTNTKLTNRSGWSPRGRHYCSQAPFGAWRTQTFIAGLRPHRMIINAPWTTVSSRPGSRPNLLRPCHRAMSSFSTMSASIEDRANRAARTTAMRRAP